MSAIEEKRIYGDRRAETIAFVASGQGAARVQVSGDRIGRFGLARRCEARDVATADGQVFVATEDDVIAGDVLAGEETFESLDFGGAVAVATTDGDVLAADEDGTVARHADGGWTTLGTLPAVRALTGDFVAAADGLYRVAGGSLTHVGLDDANDVASGGTPLAATGSGLYRLGNGWLAEADGHFQVVSAGRVEANGGDDAGSDARMRAHAATDETLLEYDGSDWTAVDLPVDEPVADVAYGECVYVVTRSGNFLVDAAPEATADGSGGWRSRSLGLPDVASLAVARPA